MAARGLPDPSTMTEIDNKGPLFSSLPSKSPTAQAFSFSSWDAPNDDISSETTENFEKQISEPSPDNDDPLATRGSGNRGVDLGIGELCFIEDTAETEKKPKKDTQLRKLTVQDTQQWHLRELEFIKNELKKAKERGQECLVLTHHAPTFHDTSNPLYLRSPIRSAFSTNLDYMFDRSEGSPYCRLHTWVSGHTHWSTDQKMGGVRIVSNQYGYTNSSECTYKPDFVIKIDRLESETEGGGGGGR